MVFSVFSRLRSRNSKCRFPVCRLVQLESEWVPHDTSSSLYIRPTMIGTEPTLGVAPSDQARLFVLLCPVGPYYSTGFKPVNLLCDPSYVRAWPGGCGFAKMGSNYSPTLWTQKVNQKSLQFIYSRGYIYIRDTV
jgi:branched-subunit amino acid aminotransferase/4-amino-4-deoxychorismate lyase